eukprot:513771-Pelagomonas_calceolata.AAC.1
MHRAAGIEGPIVRMPMHMERILCVLGAQMAPCRRGTNGFGRQGPQHSGLHQSAARVGWNQRNFTSPSQSRQPMYTPFQSPSQSRLHMDRLSGLRCTSLLIAMQTAYVHTIPVAQPEQVTHGSPVWVALQKPSHSHAGSQCTHLPWCPAEEGCAHVDCLSEWRRRVMERQMGRQMG